MRAIVVDRFFRQQLAAYADHHRDPRQPVCRLEFVGQRVDGLLLRADRRHALGLGAFRKREAAFIAQRRRNTGFIEELQQLPGVGRKTANVIASVIYNLPAMAVDTHVFRVSKRIGLAPKTAKTPLDVEKALLKHTPLEIVPKAHHWLILHGRYICVARRPKCEICPLTSFCAFYQKNWPNIPDDPENRL